jgi:two-component system, OmpR family, phosphate regulon sensor histidine kinase PhoR
MLAVGLIGGLSLERELTELQEERLVEELLRHARAARAAAETLAADASVPNIDTLADRLGEATGARITLIDAEGTVVGDSSLSLGGIAAEDNHRGRPEVVAARAGNESVVRRFSNTVDRDLLYAAVPWPQRSGVIRAAMALDSVETVLDRQRALILLAAGLGLLAALLVSALAAHLAAQTLGSLSSSARAMLGGGSTRIPVSTEDELGHLAGSLNRLADERSQTYVELAKERDRLDAVLQGINEGLIALDKELRIEIVNPAARRLLGIERVQMGSKLVETVRAPDLIDIAERGRSGATSGEFTLGDPLRHVQVRTTQLPTGGSVLVLHDVTDIRQMESMRRDLVANVSHELRTPVSIMRANAETLLDGALEDPPQARAFVQAMLRHAERLSNLLSDLLDLARIEGGAYPLAVEALEVRKAAQRAVDTLQRTAKTRSVTVNVEVPPDLRVRADAQALDQVLTNLLDNAIKYSFEGGSVDIIAHVTGVEARITVRDDGPGIQERHRARVFERFYRVDAGRSRAVGGTGLGLSIVKHLVSLMHGGVGVDPVEPHGSAFWVTLPVARSASGAERSSAA